MYHELMTGVTGMIKNAVYRLLERPWVYRLSQLLLSVGAKNLPLRIKQLLLQLPPAQRILDIGCGPSSYLWRVGLHPVGLDISSNYTATFRLHGEPAITGSAISLPFHDGSFNGVWSIGLLHHLSDGEARGAVGEMIRICRPCGYIVIFDAVLPEPAWQRPVAKILRRLDRGRFMRTQADLESFLVRREAWTCERISYSFIGLEGLLCRFLK
jgi:SAM-dependent methyltransferase